MTESTNPSCGLKRSTAIKLDAYGKMVHRLHRTHRRLDSAISTCFEDYEGEWMFEREARNDAALDTKKDADARLRRHLLSLHAAGYTRMLELSSKKDNEKKVDLTPYRSHFWKNGLLSYPHVNIILDAVDDVELRVLKPWTISICQSDAMQAYIAVIQGVRLESVVEIPFEWVDRREVFFSLGKPTEMTIAFEKDATKKLLYIVCGEYLARLAEEAKLTRDRMTIQQSRMRMDADAFKESLDRLEKDIALYENVCVKKIVEHFRLLKNDGEYLRASKVRLEPYRLKPMAVHVDVIIPKRIHPDEVAVFSDHFGRFVDDPAISLEGRTACPSRSSQHSTCTTESEAQRQEKANSMVLHGQRMELLETERSYVSKLEVLEHTYKPQLLASNQIRPFIQHAVLASIFQNTDALLNINRLFLEELEVVAQDPNWTGLGDLMHKHAIRSRRHYELYISGYEKISERLRTLDRENGSFRRRCGEIEFMPTAKGRTLSELLAEPFQRIPRYLLMLERIMKHLSIDDDASAGTYGRTLEPFEAACEILDGTARCHRLARWNREEVLQKLVERIRGCPDRVQVEDNVLLGEFPVHELDFATGQTLEPKLGLLTDDYDPNVVTEVVVTRRFLIFAGGADHHRFHIDVVDMDDVVLLTDPAEPDIIYCELYSPSRRSPLEFWGGTAIHAFRLSAQDHTAFLDLVMEAQATLRGQKHRKSTRRQDLPNGKVVFTHIYRGWQSYEKHAGHHSPALLILDHGASTNDDLTKAVAVNSAALIGVIQCNEARDFRAMLRTTNFPKPRGICRLARSNSDASEETLVEHVSKSLAPQLDHFIPATEFVSRLQWSVSSFFDQGQYSIPWKSRIARNMAAIAGLLRQEWMLSGENHVIKSFFKKKLGIKRSKERKSTQVLESVRGLIVTRQASVSSVRSSSSTSTSETCINASDSSMMEATTASSSSIDIFTNAMQNTLLSGQSRVRMDVKQICPDIPSFQGLRRRDSTTRGLW